MNTRTNILPQPKELENCNIENKAIENSTVKRWTRLQKHTDKLGKDVFFTFAPEMELNDEYSAEVSENRVLISAGSERAAFYACCTLKQLGSDFRGKIHDWADIEKRIVMIDLKRIGWNFDYLLSLIKRFAQLKINYILLEYEDKFPFQNAPAIPVKSAFTMEQIKELNECAHQHFVEVIPLVQSLAHWEYILKHEEYKELRELPQLTSQGCPLNPKVFDLFKSMASEIITAHPYSSMLHVGADEPFLLGRCQVCKKYSEDNGKNLLFGKYLNRVLHWVDDKKIIPLCWADTIIRSNSNTDDFPDSAILIDWQYIATDIRSKNVFLFQEDHGLIDYSHYKQMPQEMKEQFKDALQLDEKTKDFFSFPMLKYLKDKGNRVLGAGNINSIKNVFAQVEAATLLNTTGILSTYWGAPNSESRPYTIYETQIPGVIMTAAAAWNFEFEKTNKNSFFERCSPYVSEGKTSPDYLEFISSYENVFVTDEKKPPFDISKLNSSKESICTILAEKILLEQEFESLCKKYLSKPLFDSSAYRMLNMRSLNNSRFIHIPDETSWPNSHSDLRFFPRGKQCFNGIKYNILPDDRHSPFSVLLAGNNDNLENYPRHITIPIRAKTAVVSFAHIAVCGFPVNGVWGKYIFNYIDGSSEEVALENYKNIGSPWKIQNGLEIDIAASCEANCVDDAVLGLHSWTFFTGKDNVELLNIEVVAEPTSIIGIAAITLVDPSEYSFLKYSLEAEMNNTSREIENLKSKLNKQLPDFIDSDSSKEIIGLCFESKGNRLARIMKLVNLHSCINRQ